jgi:two-component system sensor histidine kinase KdpD
VQQGGHDEVARLGQAFNEMAGTIGRLLVDVREQAARAEAANRAKDGFLSTASHELRTPVTSIRASAGILAHYGDELRAAERSGFADAILAEAERLEALVAKVLEFSELEAGTRTWRKESVDLVQVAHDVHNAFRATAARKRVEIVVGVADAVPVPVAGDRAALTRLFGNLLENAIHFSPPDAVVAVTVARVRRQAVVRVQDRGPGVPDAVKERVFERFYQHGDLLTQKPPGLGLGLTFVRAIAKAHGGTCRCEDAPGGGATFVVVLPAAAAEERAETSSLVGSGRGHGGDGPVRA